MSAKDDIVGALVSYFHHMLNEKNRRPNNEILKKLIHESFETKTDGHYLTLSCKIDLDKFGEQL